jgi:hypothetical protein
LTVCSLTTSRPAISREEGDDDGRAASRVDGAADRPEHAAKVLLVGGLVLAAALTATIGAFVIGQPILRGNGDSSANGWPVSTLADSEALRSVVNGGSL